MNQRHHVRTGSQGRKLVPAHHARPAKPPAVRRGHSYNNAHTHAQSHSHGPGQGVTRPGSASKKLPGAEGTQLEGEEVDMSSFLQYCATCERQLITPGNSVLYCSEACRRKDVSSSHSLQAPHSPPLTPSTPPYFDYPPPDIIPQRSPTVLRPLSLAFSDFSLLDEALSRPDEPVSPTDCRSNDAAAAAAAAAPSPSWNRHGSTSSISHQNPDRRSRTSRTSTGVDSNRLPSLIHSPSSSYSTVGSMPSYRPLPPRHSNPFSAAFSTTKSIDLVLPYPVTAPSSPTQWLKDSSLKSCASTLTSFRVAEASELSYQRCPLDETNEKEAVPQDTDGTLRQLFSHEAMKAPPRRR